MKAFKTLTIAVFVSAVTAGSVVLYIDYKIDKATQAIVAPIEATTEKVGDTITGIEETLESTVEKTGDATATYLDQAREDVEYELENGRALVSDLATSAGDLWSNLSSSSS